MNTSSRWLVFSAAVCLLWLTDTTSAADLAAAKRTALTTVDALEADITSLALELWDYAEVALEEKKSSKLLADFLEQRGFMLERGVARLPTAFIAEWGEGTPILGVMAEFDALPGVGNAVTPKKAPREDGHPHGHGCGHNLFGAAAVATAAALKQTMRTHGLAGTVRLYGAPAEETLVGKVYMAKAGLFNDLDAVLDWHPSVRNGVKNHRGQAMNNFSVEFFGQSAHGAYDPWNGRSALDAAELMNHAVNLMREHIEPTARIHYVIPEAGTVPNVVPDYARAWFYLRDSDRDKVERNYAWMQDIAAGAARATQTTHKISLTTGVHELLLNRPLQEAAQRNYEIVGLPDYAADEHAFARALQRVVGAEEKGIATELEPLAPQPEPTRGGSTDVAEVSWIAPTVTIYVASAGAGLPWHSWAIAATHGRAGVTKAAHTAARVLALTGVDVLTDPELVHAARTYFRAETDDRPYQSPVPLDQVVPSAKSFPRTDSGK